MFMNLLVEVSQDSRDRGPARVRTFFVGVDRQTGRLTSEKVLICFCGGEGELSVCV